MRKIDSSAYWKRLWILQEVLLAADVQLFFRHETVDMEDLAYFATHSDWWPVPEDAEEVVRRQKYEYHMAWGTTSDWKPIVQQPARKVWHRGIQLPILLSNEIHQ